MERRDYEREHGVVNVGELFRLVVTIRSSAGFTTFRICGSHRRGADRGGSIGPSDSDTAFDLARKMFTPTESGDAFQKQYFAAIQRDPAVVMEHAELARLFSQTLPKEGKE